MTKPDTEKLTAPPTIQTSKTIEPPILYFGTPVVLISTMNETGHPNLTPVSSAWALGWSIVLGLEATAKGKANLERSGQCVLNIPSADLWRQVERLAPLTGNNPVPAHKRDKFRYEPDKFTASGFTPIPSELVQPPRVAQCPLQLECELQAMHLLHNHGQRYPVELVAAEVHVLRVHARSDLVIGQRHIDPEKWNPLIYSFRHYFGLGPELGKTFRATV